jgi:inward rectifier potassium channel
MIDQADIRCEGGALRAERKHPVMKPPQFYQAGRLRYEVRGLRVTPFADLFHFLMQTAWSTLLASFMVIYGGVNALFATFYWLGGSGTILNARPGSFADDFWFSVQTYATIGYGTLAPGSTYAHVLVTFESFCGMLSVALSTGVLFAKFSRPKARVAFSNNALVCVRNGQPCLVWRVANRRDTSLLTPSAQAYVLIDEVSAEGHRMRRNQLLELERSALPVFLSAWTLIHQLDETSPLYGLSVENAAARLVGIIVSPSAVDETMLQSVHARQLYNPEDLRFGMRFADMLDTSNRATLVIDHSQMDELVVDQEARS